MTESDLFDPCDKLIEIKVLGREVQVPENNTLLRCFQFLSMKTISYGDFCWNGECTNCQVWYRNSGESRDEKPALSCRLAVTEGMVVTRLSPFVQLPGIPGPPAEEAKTRAGRTPLNDCLPDETYHEENCSGYSD